MYPVRYPVVKDIENRESVSYKRSLLIGMLLGKTHSKILSSGEQQRAEFTVEHTQEQSDFLAWKAMEIERLLKVKVTFFNREDKKGFSFAAGRRARIVHKWFHSGNRKVITPKIRFMGHPVGLAMLLCDTAIVQECKQSHSEDSIGDPLVSVRLDAFMEGEMMLLANHLKAMVDVDTTIEVDTHGLKRSFYVHFDATNSKLIWNVVKRWLPPVKSMQAKFHSFVTSYGT